MSATATALAFDGTVRSVDKDGRMHIAKSHISKATVNPYFGSEIPNSQALGLIPTQIYYLFRDPKELARAASTFARLPILMGHKATSAKDHPEELVVGAIGSDVEFNDPYLDADVCIWTDEAIAGIETDTVREFSCSYRYVAVMTPGEYHGQRYDGVMTEIHGNHLALVEAGRAGSDVLAADEAIKTMKTTTLGKALIVTLGGMSPKLAQDSAFLALVAEASKKTINPEEMSTAIVAMDASLDPKKIKMSFDALLALDADKEDKPAEDGEDDEEEKKKKMAADAEEEADKKKAAEDAEEEKKEDKKAMDAAISTAIMTAKNELREANEARMAVRDVVGEVLAQDSAEAIYGFALDQMSVDHKDVTGVPAMKALFTLAKTRTVPAPRVAMDSATMATKFPALARFSQA